MAAGHGRMGGTVTGAMDEVERLIEAIVRSDVKRSWLAEEVGISSHVEPDRERREGDRRRSLVQPAGSSSGSQPSTFLGESASPFLTWDLQTIREAVTLLYEKFVLPDPVPAEPKRSS